MKAVEEGVHYYESTTFSYHHNNIPRDATWLKLLASSFEAHSQSPHNKHAMSVHRILTFTIRAVSVKRFFYSRL